MSHYNEMVINMEWLDIFLSLSALIILEIILGIDNLIFLSILTSPLPVKERKKTRSFGLMFAWITRLIFLFFSTWMVHFTKPLFSIGDLIFSVSNIFLLAGGIFLMIKATEEIHVAVSKNSGNNAKNIKKVRPWYMVVMQIGLMDIIFSLDSVLTAIGLTNNFGVMAVAITCAILVMLYANEPVSQFITKFPTFKILGLAFLIVIGIALVADGLSFHIPRGYIYFSMGLAFCVAIVHLLWKK